MPTRGRPEPDRRPRLGRDQPDGRRGRLPDREPGRPRSGSTPTATASRTRAKWASPAQTITLIGGGADGLVSTTADNTIATTITAADGTYLFTGLTPGVEYQVQFTKPAGTVFTGRDLGADASDSDADATSGRSQIVVLASGETNLTVDAGVYRTASLGDRLWLDANANGQQDAGEVGIAGQTITLVGGGADGLISTAADNTIATTITAADGTYLFAGLTPGVEYQVQFSEAGRQRLHRPATSAPTPATRTPMPRPAAARSSCSPRARTT